MQYQFRTTTNGYLNSIFIIVIICAAAIGCSKSNDQQAIGAVLKTCRGVYYTRDTQGSLKKFNEYFNSSANACYTDNMALNHWETTSEAWDKNKVTCVPQPQFQSRSLISANNYFSYRDARSFLDLDSATGVFRRIVIADGNDGNPTFSRLQGCFYQRTGQGIDVVYGNQILLDTEITKVKSTEYFDPMEIFSYVEMANSVEMVRFDSSSDWNYKFCPELSTPWGYCDLLRNGNMMFYPTLTASQMNSLLTEALLIRKQFNFTTITKSQFENIWSATEKTHHEIGRTDWMYMVNGIVDTPYYIDQAWRDYVRGSRPFMPDAKSTQLKPLCYNGKREVALEDGTKGYVYGEICYQDGKYEFTQL